MNKVWNILFLLLITVYLIVSFSFTGRKMDSVICSGVQVKVIDSTLNRFVDSGDVIRILEKNNIKTTGLPISSINTLEIEEAIGNNSIVKDVKAFITSAGILHIEVSQRIPVLRIINTYQQSYYIDEEGALMPWNGRYSAFVPVANGNIRYVLRGKKTINVRDSLVPVLSDLYSFAMLLKKDRFWGSQIEQIYVNNKQEYELIPRVGAHVILLGSMENVTEKLKNLKKLYDRGFGEAGWNGYTVINLKFKNQIVCTRRQ